MIDSIKKALFAQFNPEETKGIFLSAFSDDKKLLVSQWIVETDRPLRDTVWVLYDDHIKWLLKKLTYIVYDVVVDVIEIHDTNDLWEMSPEEFWIIIADKKDDKTWVILPNTSWVADMKWAIYQLKQKYWIHWTVDIAVFRTERVVVAK